MLIAQAQSEKDRISISKFGNVTSTAIRKPNNEIEVITEATEEANKKESTLLPQPKLLFLGFLHLLALFGMTIFKGYFLIPKITAGVIGTIYYLLPVAVYTIVVIINTVVLFNKGGIQLQKNHGAEHMTLAAYRKLKRIPTIAEVKNYSRISRTCGGTLASGLITGQLIGFLLYINGIILPEKIIFFIPFMLRSIFPFNVLGKLLQLYTTKRPDDSNIELAIAALDALEHSGNTKEPDNTLEDKNSI